MAEILIMIRQLEVGSLFCVFFAVNVIGFFLNWYIMKSRAMRKKVIIKIFQSSKKVYLMFHIPKRFKDVNGNLFPTEFNKNKEDSL